MFLNVKLFPWCYADLNTDICCAVWRWNFINSLLLVTRLATLTPHYFRVYSEVGLFSAAVWNPLRWAFSQPLSTLTTPQYTGKHRLTTQTLCLSASWSSLHGSIPLNWSRGPTNHNASGAFDINANTNSPFLSFHSCLSEKWQTAVFFQQPPAVLTSQLGPAAGGSVSVHKHAHAFPVTHMWDF